MNREDIIRMARCASGEGRRMTEAERLAQELLEEIDGFPEATKLEQEAAALLRSQASEIERLRGALEKIAASSASYALSDLARAALGVKHD